MPTAMRTMSKEKFRQLATLKQELIELKSLLEDKISDFDTKLEQAEGLVDEALDDLRQQLNDREDEEGADSAEVEQISTFLQRYDDWSTSAEFDTSPLDGVDPVLEFPEEFGA